MSDPVASTRVLVVEDDPNIVDLIRSNLAVRGFDTVVSQDGMRVLKLLETEDPDIVLLDLMLPEADGFELCRQIRERSLVGIIVVSARGGERDKVTALNMGADDYLTKPFSIEELLARITATLRRTRPAVLPEPQTPVVVAGDITIDLARQQVTRLGQPVHLTPDRVRPAAGAGHKPREAADALTPASPGLGSRIRDRDRIRPRLRAPSAGEIGGRGGRAADPHPAAGGLPFRAGVTIWPLSRRLLTLFLRRRGDVKGALIPLGLWFRSQAEFAVAPARKGVKSHPSLRTRLQSR